MQNAEGQDLACVKDLVLNLLADVALVLSDAAHIRGPGLAGPVTS